ncbi:MAG: RsmB/NOP family class I SAM-dependent RNA methyltransferase [Verrucomicrobium sp.]
MKLHRHLIEQIIATLAEIFARGTHADKAIERMMKAHPKWGARDRRFFFYFAYDLVRWWRWYWYLSGQADADHCKVEMMNDAKVWRVWAAYWMQQGNELPPFAECRGPWNEGVEQRAQAHVLPAIRLSIPDWLQERGSREFGKEWPELMKALNKPADVFLRANTLRITPVELQAKLEGEGIESHRVKGLPDALRLSVRKNVFTTQAFKEGLFEVQDAASQQVAPFLQVAPGQRVVDSCAGAGGKTLHLAALMQNKGALVAMDVHQWKLDEMRRRARRNGVSNVEPRLIEDAKAIKRLASKADRVLLDVPCSGLGVIRRNPDAKWKLTEAELDRLQTLQQEILVSHSRMVKPGGKLVYATCSLFPSENERQVQAFLATHGEHWKLEEELHLRPDREGFDGFYAARLVKLAEEPAPAPAPAPAPDPVPAPPAAE